MVVPYRDIYMVASCRTTGIDHALLTWFLYVFLRYLLISRVNRNMHRLERDTDVSYLTVKCYSAGCLTIR